MMRSVLFLTLCTLAAAFTTLRHGASCSVRSTALNSETTSTVKSDVDTYAKCSKCTAAFQIGKDQLNNKGRRVTCGVCGHSWFQSSDKLFTLNGGKFEFVPYPKEEVESVKAGLQAGKRNDPSVYTGESKLYVGNLSYDVTEEDLVWLFSQQAGDVGDVSIITDRETGRSRGFAFVTLLSEEAGEKGINLDGVDFCGRNLQVATSRLGETTPRRFDDFSKRCFDDKDFRVTFMPYRYERLFERAMKQFERRTKYMAHHK